MPAAELIFASIEAARLAMSAIEAAQNGDEAKAREYLQQVQARVQAADDAWQAAGQN